MSYSGGNYPEQGVGTYTQAATNALTTELNALANATASAASAAIDNSTGRDLYMDLELNLAVQGSARSSGAIVSVYMVASLDGGSTYADVNTGVAELVAVFPLDAAVTARVAVRRRIPLSPGLFKLVALNGTGQAFAATGSTLRYRTFTVTNI